MKKILSILFVIFLSMVALNVFGAATVTYNLWDFEGVAMNTVVEIAPTNKVQALGTGSLVGPTKRFTPTNGTLVVTQAIGPYRITIAPKIPFWINVPASGDHNVNDLILSGVTLAAYTNLTWAYGVKVTSLDTTPGFLTTKLLAGAGVGYVTNSPGGNETITQSWNPSNFVSSFTLWDSANSNRKLTAGLSGAADPTIEFFNNSIKIFTNYMVITNGLVGIGTESPIVKLDIVENTGSGRNAGLLLREDLVSGFQIYGENGSTNTFIDSLSVNPNSKMNFRMRVLDQVNTAMILDAAGGVTFPNGFKIAIGSNQRAGNSVLAGGTVTVANTGVTANTLLLHARKTLGGTAGDLTYTLSAGVSFTINSSSGTDTSTITYLLIENP